MTDPQMMFVQWRADNKPLSLEKAELLDAGIDARLAKLMTELALANTNNGERK